MLVLMIRLPQREERKTRLKLKSMMKCLRERRPQRLGHLEGMEESSWSTIFPLIFWQFTVCFLCNFDWPQVKQDLISSIVIFVNQLPHNLRNNVRLWIFRDQAMIGKSQNWIRAKTIVQSSLQKSIFVNSMQGLCKRQEIFLILSNLPCFFFFFFCFWTNILTRIAC